MRKRMLLGMVVLTVFALSACGNKPENQVKEQTPKSVVEQEKVMESKTIKLLSKDNYYMEISTKSEGMEFTSQTSVKDGKIASSTSTDDGIVRTIEDGDTIYTIMEREKMIMQTKVNDPNVTLMEKSKDFTVEEDATYTTGKETIEGKEYDFEDFNGIKYYYDKEDLKFIKSEDVLVKVLAFESKPREDMFKIPTDYTDISAMAVEPN